MYNVYLVMPFGNRSRGYNFEDRKKAERAFDRLVAQIRSWPKTGTLIDVIIHGDGRIVGETVEC